SHRSRSLARPRHTAPRLSTGRNQVGRSRRRVSEVLARMSGRGIVVSRPQVIRSGQEMALTIAEPVLGNNQEVVAAVVAIVSFQEVFDAVQQPTSKSERELLNAGLPVVFVVDQNGRAVAHPEASVAFS